MKIVILDGRTLNPGDNPWTSVEQLGDVTVYDRTTEAQFLERAGDAEVLVINKFKLTAQRLNSLPNLGYIAVTATGFDCVDIQSARSKGIPVSNVPIYGTDSVAQYVFAMLFHILHRIDLHDQAIRAGEWQARSDFSFWLSPLTEIAGKTIGVVGFGRIGKQVGAIAQAMGMHVITANRRPPENAPGVRHVSLAELQQRADIISLNCPLNNETQQMVNQSFLANCRPNCVLINASRGALICEQDLANALNQGIIAAAGVDVASTEPIERDNPLLTAKNLFITPHLAWATLEARQRLMQTTADNIRSYIEGNPINVVNA